VVGGVDHRIWLETDRPEERIAVGSPLPGLQVMSVRDSDRQWAEYHTQYRLCLLDPEQHGVGASYVCRGSHGAGAGDMMAFEPGDHHVTTRVSGKASFNVVEIASEQLERAAQEFGISGRFHFRSVQMNSPEVAAAIQHLVDSVAASSDKLELEVRYAEVMQLLIERCAETPVSRRRWDPVPHYGIRTARDYLRDNCHENPSLEDLAKRAGLTRFAFAHAFKKYVGMAPHAYLRLRRACEARTRIEHGYPVSDVMSALGYVDVPLLTRTLKGYFGAPPGRWRRCFQANSGPHAH
jgi:AraC-like DNA-binding protein